MSKSENINKINRGLHKLGFKFKKHSPELMVIGGVVGMVVSTVMACKATTKVHDILEENKKKVNDVNELLKDETVSEETYSIKDSKKDLAIIHTKTGLKMIKLYAPAVILGGLSITSILTGHNILRKRNIAVAAAYTTIDKSFKGYRERVVERFGSDLDKELRYNVKAKEIKETIIDEDGKEKTVTQNIKTSDMSEAYSDYARCYDTGCSGWEKDAEHNLWYLRRQEQFANDKLKSEGYLFLNEVYDMLGIPRTKAGQCVGWVYDLKDKTKHNFVDFGIYDINKEQCKDFVNGYERSIWLDFNVDGNILDLI